MVSRPAGSSAADRARRDASAASRPNALGKVTAIVEAVTTESRLTRIASAVELPASTVHRILQELVDLGWVRADGRRGYTLGARLLAIGARASEGTSLLHVADPFLRHLRDATGHTVHMAARQQDEMVYLAKVEGHGAYEMRSHVGLTVPLHCTAVGKCLLAALPPSEVRSVVQRTGLPRRTDRTITEVEKLLEQLEAVRRNGFARDDEENQPKVQCVGALIVDPHGLPAASVSVSSLLFDVNATVLSRHAKLVTATARQISQAIGAPLHESGRSGDAHGTSPRTAVR